MSACVLCGVCLLVLPDTSFAAPPPSGRGGQSKGSSQQQQRKKPSPFPGAGAPTGFSGLFGNTPSHSPWMSPHSHGAGLHLGAGRFTSPALGGWTTHGSWLYHLPPPPTADRNWLLHEREPWRPEYDLIPERHRGLEYPLDILETILRREQSHVGNLFGHGLTGPGRSILTGLSGNAVLNQALGVLSQAERWSFMPDLGYGRDVQLFGHLRHGHADPLGRLDFGGAPNPFRQSHVMGLGWLHTDPYMETFGGGSPLPGRHGVMPPFGGFEPVPGLIFGTPPFPSVGGRRGYNWPLQQSRQRPAPRAPTPEEQRNALRKMRDQLDTLEMLAGERAWVVLAAGLKDQPPLPGLPELTAALRGVQTESDRLAALGRIRRHLTTAWFLAPDAGKLGTDLETLRTATADRELADRVRRLLAVKATWEGHDPVARSLIPGESAFDLDDELAALKGTAATATADGPGVEIASVGPELPADWAREIACRQATRSLLADLDRRLTAGRYTVGIHVREVREFSTALGRALEQLDGKQPQSKAPTFDATVEAVARDLGRPLTRSERLIARHMHLAGKPTDEITHTLK
jgi:hypothetical protein